MAHLKKARKRANKRAVKKTSSRKRTPFLVFVAIITLAFGFLSASHIIKISTVEAESNNIDVEVDPNFHIKTLVTQFFSDNDASEMIPIIKCESRFRHYEPDGTPLKNKQGSTAIGVAQILASKHPDPKIIQRYNKKVDMDLTVEDFDITTFEGNIGYALVLYKVRGVRDWECSKKFRF